MTKSNCLIFAIALYIRRFGKDEQSYIVMRRSHYGWFPHFLYQRTVGNRHQLISYIPIDPRHKKLPPPFFTGRVKWGDR